MSACLVVNIHKGIETKWWNDRRTFYRVCKGVSNVQHACVPAPHWVSKFIIAITYLSESLYILSAFWVPYLVDTCSIRFWYYYYYCNSSIIINDGTRLTHTLCTQHGPSCQRLPHELSWKPRCMNQSQPALGEALYSSLAEGTWHSQEELVDNSWLGTTHREIGIIKGSGHY